MKLHVVELTPYDRLEWLEGRMPGSWFSKLGDRLGYQLRVWPVCKNPFDPPHLGGDPMVYWISLVEMLGTRVENKVFEREARDRKDNLESAKREVFFTASSHFQWLHRQGQTLKNVSWIMAPVFGYEREDDR